MKNPILPVFQHAVSFVREWISQPLNKSLAVLAGLLLFSAAAWISSGPKDESLLYFASPSGHTLRAETRVLPLENGIEKRAALLTSELVLGPRSRSTRPLFAEGTRLDSVLYRKGTIYLDLSPEASLSLDPPLSLGIKGLRRTLAAGLPGWQRIIVTVGGMPALHDRR
ncbi:MAG: GerMN domain-containing protein [Rectinemataceae bacterium]|nr:GerMN domain-containing protein [Rectinemataceae bacterium]